MSLAYTDGHAHLAPVPGAAKRLLAVMDANAIGRTVVVSGGLLSPDRLSEQIALGGGSDVDADNEALLEACHASDGRLIPFYFANPHRDGERYQSEGASFRGLKLAPAIHGVPLCDVRHRALIHAAEELGHPVYLHCLARPGFAVSDLVALSCFFPQVNFILGHAGVGNCDLYAVSLIRSHPNIYFETSGGFSAVVRAAIESLGPERVIFGSEYPLQSVSAEMAKMREIMNGSDGADLVMGRNMLNLCRLARDCSREAV